jgi:predicted GNAT family acetyltransferase
MSERTALTVRDNTEKSRFEALDEAGVVAGFIKYRRSEGRIEFIHTEVDDAFEGRGVGSTLVRAALDKVRTTDQLVVASCPFVKDWIGQHPDYEDLTTR